MAKSAKLKVYRTPIGFHDAFVAATSQKAALAAWGSDADLFSRGIAEVVTDAALTAEPLAQPGKVVRRLRGTAAEQIAEASKSAILPTRTKDVLPADPKLGAKARARASRKPAPKPKPRPDRAKLDAAEAAVEQAEAKLRAEDKRIAGEMAALISERSGLRARAETDLTRLERVRLNAETAYKRAIAKWRE